MSNHEGGGPEKRKRAARKRRPVSRQQEGHADAADEGGDRRTSRDGRLLQRLTLSEWLTLLVAVGSLAVSGLTYLNAADTADLKKAVGSLTALASQTKRQADAANGQIGELRRQAMSSEAQVLLLQDQLQAGQDQADSTRNLAAAAAGSAEAARAQTQLLRDERRPWLEVSSPKITGFVTELGDEFQYFTVDVAATGQRPALRIHVVSTLVVWPQRMEQEQARVCRRPNAGAMGPAETTTLFPGQRYTKRVVAIDGLSLATQRIRGDVIGLTGCVLYADFDGSWHQTGFSYRLYAPRMVPSLTPDFPLDADAAILDPLTPVIIKIVPNPTGPGPIS